MPTYYLMKVRGKAKIPDYIQLRDESMTLVGYFRPGRRERLLKVIQNEHLTDQLQVAIEGMDKYGKLLRVELEEPDQ